MDRTLFGHPIRKETTELQYPRQLTLEEFCDHIKKSVDPFKKNMYYLGGASQEDKYVEEWTEQFLAWCEIEEDREQN